MSAPQSSSSTDSGMSLHVSIYIDPSNRTAFLEHFKPCFEAVRAEKECTFFEVFSDPDDEGHLSWVENWSKGKEWFMTEQITKDYYKPYLAATEPMFVKPREAKFYERMERDWVFSKAENFK
ncbi:MAG: hypothetical protein LQ339_006683 [Xanthoria mediterranea]|nr:MAG: hypothetical protein LQ339_006683 [Xanthoria mediterranea]